MSKTALRVLAVLLSFLIVLVLAAGLDDLPRDLRDRIGTAQKEIALARSRVDQVQGELNQALASEPDLFRARSMNTALPARLQNAGSELQQAEQDMAALAVLRKANRRQDRDRAQQLLAREEGLRQSALASANSVGADTRRWLEYKNNLPATLRQMDQDYRLIRGYDLAGLTTAVEKAQTDWPEKKPDLEARLAAVRALPEQAAEKWQSSSAARDQAAGGKLAGLDLGGLVDIAESLHADAASLPRKADELKSLNGQLYTSWDKILVDLDQRRHGSSRDYLEKLRTVRTRVTDPVAKNGETTSDEAWVEVSKAQYEAFEKNLGMVVEHKPAGKYDTEAERVVQPPGFAYMAPVSQGSNQYGYWEHRGGQSFWVFYGQYALLRDLLFNRDYRPPNSGEYEEYRSYQRRGQTYYGHSEGTSTPKYGTQGSSTQSRYSGSTYMRSGGGFRDSQYASRPGGFRGSQYESPASRRGREDSPGWSSPSRPKESHSFGRGSPSRPRPSFGGGGGRRFGGGRR